MCCTEVLNALDQKIKEGDANAQEARSAFFKLAITCFPAGQTVSVGLLADLEEQKLKEQKTKTHLHAEALLQLLDHKEDTINTRQNGLDMAKKLLDGAMYVNYFTIIQNQCQ